MFKDGRRGIGQSFMFIIIDGSSEEIVQGMSAGVPASLEYVDAVPAVVNMSQRGGVRVDYQD